MLTASGTQPRGGRMYRLGCGSSLRQELLSLVHDVTRIKLAVVGVVELGALEVEAPQTGAARERVDHELLDRLVVA